MKVGNQRKRARNEWRSLDAEAAGEGARVSADTLLVSES